MDTRRGFTLVELAIVLSVAAVLTAVIVPDMIEAARARMASRAAEDMARIQDAAKWFFLHSDPVKGQELWPGEVATGTCNGTPAQVQAALINAGYISNADLVNPWGQRYEIDLVFDTDPTQCFLRVGTPVPYDAQFIMLEYSPNTGRAFEDPPKGVGTAATTGSAAAAGFYWGSTAIPKPGTEPGLP
jgi:prepilin-type N-terminal cleavage/methylation domain-containing protein